MDKCTTNNMGYVVLLTDNTSPCTSTCTVNLPTPATTCVTRRPTPTTNRVITMSADVKITRSTLCGRTNKDITQVTKILELNNTWPLYTTITKSKTMKHNKDTSNKWMEQIHVRFNTQHTVISPQPAMSTMVQHQSHHGNPQLTISDTRYPQFVPTLLQDYL